MHAARRAITWARACAGAALLLAVGCSAWREEQENPSTLPAARMSPDSVVLEIYTLEASPEPASLQEETWRQLDEQHLPAEARLLLAANGLRCGRCGLQLPVALLELLEGSHQPTTEGRPAEPEPVVCRRLQSRSGRRGKIVVSGPHERLDVLRQEFGQPRGEVYEQATCVVAVRTFPLGDGRVRVELTPEIEYGEPKQRLVEGEGALRFEPSQERRVYDDLAMESLLSPGQTLVLSTAPAMAGLGRAFFVRESPQGRRPLFLIVRLAQTQHDDRFAPEQAAAPLVTPTE